MTQTAENCASKWNVTTVEQHEVVLRRLEQYNDALADDSAFLKRFMTLPFDVPDARFRKTVSTMNGDEGIFQSTAEGLAKLRTVKEGGTITFGGQTHPADGAAGMVITTQEKAKELSADSAITIKIASFGQARGEKSFMPAATIPASMQALVPVFVAEYNQDFFGAFLPFFGARHQHATVATVDDAYQL